MCKDFLITLRFQNEGCFVSLFCTNGQTPWLIIIIKFEIDELSTKLEWYIYIRFYNFLPYSKRQLFRGYFFKLGSNGWCDLLLLNLESTYSLQSQSEVCIRIFIFLLFQNVGCLWVFLQFQLNALTVCQVIWQSTIQDV